MSISQILCPNRYNGDGQRVRMGDGNDAKHYYYLGQALFFTKNGAGDANSENVITPDGRIVASMRETEGNKYYF